MKIDIRPKKKSKKSNKKEPKSFDLSKYQQVQHVDYEVEQKNIYNDGRGITPITTLPTPSGDKKLRKLFDDIVKGEKRLTEIQCGRMHENEIREKNREIESLKKQALALRNECKRAKQRHAKLRGSHVSNTSGLVDQKQALARQVDELNEKLENSYFERDRWKVEEITLKTQIEQLKDEKKELQREMKKRQVKTYNPNVLSKREDYSPVAPQRSKKSFKSKPKVGKKRKLIKKMKPKRKLITPIPVYGRDGSPKDDDEDDNTPNFFS